MIAHQDEAVTVHHGDALLILRELADCSVDSVVCDPPYGLADHPRRNVEKALLAWLTGDREHVPNGRGFMSKQWDAFVPPPAMWDECFRVLKPGGYLLAFSAPRTQDLMGISIRLAGFDADISPEIRDSIMWVFGSGFPKSLDVSKAIDKKRDDQASVLAVTSRLADLAEAAKITRADLDDHMGTSDMGGWWLSRLPHRAACPSVENWAKLRDFIPGAPELDAEVWRLNGRKGTPGEAWEQREVVGTQTGGIHSAFDYVRLGTPGKSREFDITAPATDDARTWQGWGTALKPAHEPIIVARKPLAGTVAENVLRHGTGAINVDACRVGTDGGGTICTNRDDTGRCRGHGNAGRSTSGETVHGPDSDAGRWPPNVVLSHAPDCILPGDEPCDDAPDCAHDGDCQRGPNCRTYCPVAELDRQSGTSTPKPARTGRKGGSYPHPMDWETKHGEQVGTWPADDGSGASRFFPIFRYEPKAPTSERPRVAKDGAGEARVLGKGLSDQVRECRTCGNRTIGGGDGRSPNCGHGDFEFVPTERRADHVAHPTVKPLDLMRWLVRLVTPPNGLVLDWCAGSGTTGEAAILEHMRAILIEREADYLPLIIARLTKPMQVGFDFGEIA